MKIIKQQELYRKYLHNKEHIDNAIRQCITNSTFTHGAELINFENEFKQYTQSEDCVGVSSGTSALHLALLALGIKHNDEVLVPSFTFFATAEVINQVGAKPIFVDSDSNYLLDLNDAESKISKKTKAIITVDLFGQTLDNKMVSNFVKKHNIYFIQDCTHSAGAKYNNQSTSIYADLACWSFNPSKNLGCFGDAGAVTGSSLYINKIRLLCNHGRLHSKNKPKEYIHNAIGWNSRLDVLQASILRINLTTLDYENSLRRQHAKFYNKKLAKLPIQLPIENTWSYHVYHQYVILVNDRNKLYDYMKKNNISLGIHYPVACHQQPIYKKMYGEIYLPNASYFAKHCISLPIHPYINLYELNMITNKIIEFYSN